MLRSLVWYTLMPTELSKVPAAAIVSATTQVQQMRKFWTSANSYQTTPPNIAEPCNLNQQFSD
jgi:hypothetical protein